MHAHAYVCIKIVYCWRCCNTHCLCMSVQCHCQCSTGPLHPWTPDMWQCSWCRGPGCQWASELLHLLCCQVILCGCSWRSLWQWECSSPPPSPVQEVVEQRCVVMLRRWYVWIPSLTYLQNGNIILIIMLKLFVMPTFVRSVQCISLICMHQPCDVVVVITGSLHAPFPIALTALTLIEYEVLGDRRVIVTAVTSVVSVISGEPLPLHHTAYHSRGTPPV